MKLSEAQARLLARLWGSNESCHVNFDFNGSTISAVVRKGFLASNGKLGRWPNGAGYDEHDITPSGLRALAEFFATLAPPPSGEGR